MLGNTRLIFIDPFFRSTMTFDFHLSKTLQGLEGSIAALAFSNDYRYLGSASQNGSGEGIVRIYDVEAQFQTFWSHRRPSQFGVINWDRDCRLIMGTVTGELLMISPKAQVRKISTSSRALSSITVSETPCRARRYPYILLAHQINRVQ